MLNPRPHLSSTHYYNRNHHKHSWSALVLGYYNRTPRSLSPSFRTRSELDDLPSFDTSTYELPVSRLILMPIFYYRRWHHHRTVAVDSRAIVWSLILFLYRSSAAKLSRMVVWEWRGGGGGGKLIFVSAHTINSARELLLIVSSCPDYLHSGGDNNLPFSSISVHPLILCISMTWNRIPFI